MKLHHSILNGMARGFGFSLIVAIIGTGYIALWAYASLPQANSGTPISANAWNNIVNYTNKAIKQDAETVVVSDGKVGIGTTTPDQKLSVAGTVESTSGGFKFPDGSIQSTSAVSDQALKSANGYTRLPSWLLIQWGTTTLSTAVGSNNNFHYKSGTATFPTAFNTVLQVLASFNGSTVSYSPSVSVTSFNNTSANFVGNSWYNNNANVTVTYIAIGY